MSEGVALHRVVCDSTGSIVDYRILEVNPAFECLTGLMRSAVVGRLGSEAYGTGVAPFLDVYSGVVRTGKSVHFD